MPEYILHAVQCVCIVAIPDYKSVASACVPKMTSTNIMQTKNIMQLYLQLCSALTDFL